MKKIIMLSLLAIFVIATILFLKNLFFPDDQTTLYGNRLDNIEEYNITQKDEVKKAFNDLEAVSQTDIRIQGKTINITVTLSKEPSKIKEEASKAVNLFKEETLSFYDVQVFIKTTEESENFPIIGYKNNDTDNIVWTN